VSEPKIENNVPMPPNQSKKYPTGKLEVGQSFTIPYEDRRKIAGTFHRHAPKRFARRVVVEDGIKLVRVWRVS
jgi:hypothetical protein